MVGWLVCGNLCGLGLFDLAKPKVLGQGTGPVNRDVWGCPGGSEGDLAGVDWPGLPPGLWWVGLRNLAGSCGRRKDDDSHSQASRCT